MPVTAEVPLVRAHGLLFVELTWKGEPILALLDTGANASAIHSGRAGSLAAVGEGEVLGTTGTLHAESVAVEGLLLAELPLPPLRSTRRDLGGLLAPEGRRVEMILGSDAFAGQALMLDFERGRMRVTPSEPPDPAELAEGEVRMQLDEGIPSIGADLAGLEVELRIDTGASLFDSSDVYVNVPTRVWDEMRERDSTLAPSSMLRGSGASGESVDLPVVRVRGARLGSVELDAVHLIVQPVAGYFARPDSRGFVGVNFLEKLGSVTLDYGAGRLRALRRAIRS